MHGKDVKTPFDLFGPPNHAVNGVANCRETRTGAALLDQQRSKVGLGVAGDPAYGNDSPLYGAMGFVRKSEKKSGLTRKKKPTT